MLNGIIRLNNQWWWLVKNQYAIDKSKCTCGTWNESIAENVIFVYTCGERIAHDLWVHLFVWGGTLLYAIRDMLAVRIITIVDKSCTIMYHLITLHLQNVIAKICFKPISLGDTGWRWRRCQCRSLYVLKTVAYPAVEWLFIQCIHLVLPIASPLKRYRISQELCAQFTLRCVSLQSDKSIYLYNVQGCVIGSGRVTYRQISNIRRTFADN